MSQPNVYFKRDLLIKIIIIINTKLVLWTAVSLIISETSTNVYMYKM